MKFRYFFFILALFFLLGACQKSIKGDRVQLSSGGEIKQDKTASAHSSLSLRAHPSESKTETLADNQDELDKQDELEIGGITANEMDNQASSTKTDVAKSAEPDFLDYPVPFAAQAPYGDWDELHQEACEEASMIMVSRFYNHQNLTPHLMEQEILNLVKWQADNGYQVDLAAREVGEILKDYFKLEAEIIKTVTVEEIKAQLNQGNLIIVPAAGRELGNPYFRQPGPIYHMLVIRGYDNDQQEFITNDPGTKRGESFRYNYQILLKAIADWDWQLAQDGMTAEEIKQGRKEMIA